MSDFSKAQLESTIRGAVYLSAGAWIGKHPEFSGVIEGLTVALIAYVTTYLDNKKKNPPTGPEKVTVTLG